MTFQLSYHIHNLYYEVSISNSKLKAMNLKYTEGFHFCIVFHNVIQADDKLLSVLLCLPSNKITDMCH